ncbi:MAG: GDP-mannose 4,6-dehydratase [Pseudomonadota bacterium]
MAIEAAIGGPPLTVFGDDYATPDGTAVRDYVHVVDLAQAHLRAVQRLLSGGESLTVNLGRGVGSSVYNVIDAVETAVGARPRFTVGPRRTGDPAALFADAAKAGDMLGWQADFDLDAIIEHAVAWRLGHGRRFFREWDNIGQACAR